MADHIRERINRKLSTLGDERLYQVLDFVEFLELRYGQPAANPTPANPFQRFADGVEDRLRAGGVAASTVSEAMGFLNKAVGVLNDVASAGRTVATTVATDFASAAQRITDPPVGGAAGPASAPGTASAQGTRASGATAPPPPAAAPAAPSRPATDPTDMPSYPSPS